MKTTFFSCILIITLFSCSNSQSQTSNNPTKNILEGEKDIINYAKKIGMVGAWVDGTGNIVRIQEGKYRTQDGEIKDGLVIYPKRGIDINHPILLDIQEHKIKFKIHNSKSDFMVDFVENKIYFYGGNLYNLSGKMNKI
jgi:hypothetical protein